MMTRNELALEVFAIHSQHEIETLGDQKQFCQTVADWHLAKVAQLEATNAELLETKTLWWRLACGRLGILEDVKNKVMPPEDYYLWAEKFIDDETAKLDAKVAEQSATQRSKHEGA